MADIDATKAKSTIFIGGIAQGVDEAVLLQTFSPFGDIMEIQIPPAPGTHGDLPAEGRFSACDNDNLTIPGRRKA
ncbi:SubName: Full=Uncharacterized protein {ECO:0000313/EMBL:KIM31081.1} [Serendipita indica DSM 11827]|nr:SubName: Full=Uncharacterized protein {ECO:0000313/EMBL:KIM31081.1} [Serendipita indica DSM 11827]